jgi:hypothetical protein
MLFATMDNPRRTKQNLPNPPTGESVSPIKPPIEPLMYASFQAGLAVVAVMQAAPKISLI